MELVRDVLDKQIHDEQDCKIGKVDGLVMVLRQGRAPRVVALEVGLATLGARIHPRCGRWLYRLERKWRVTKSEPVRILFEHVVKTGIDVVVNVGAHRTGALKWEDWLRDNVISRIPGSRR